MNAIGAVGRNVLTGVKRAADNGAAASNPQDAVTLQGVPEQLTMGQLRAIVAAAQPKPEKRIDVNKIPFGIEIELENFDRAAAAQTIPNMEAWNVHPTYHNWAMVHDESLPNWRQGRGGEAVSPPMNLEGGRAEKQIREVLRQMVGLGGTPTNNCGLHVHVDASQLGEKGLANLMKIALEQERAMYKLSQNGDAQHRGTINGAGFRHNEPFYYTKPLGAYLTDPFAVMHADTPNEFRNHLYGQIPPRPDHPRPALPDVNSSEVFRPDHRDSTRYFGINFNSYWYRGTIEFRLFNATIDPDTMMDDIKLVLGTVAAAANGEYTYLNAQPMSLQNTNAPVSKEAFDYYLSKTAPDAKSRERLTRMFVNGGGTFIEDAPIKDPNILNTAWLLHEGCTFQVGGKAVTSPFEIVGALGNRDRTLSVTDDSGASQPVQNAAALERVVSELEARSRLSPADMQRLSVATEALRGQGFSFYSTAPGGEPFEITRDNQISGAMVRGRLGIRKNDDKRVDTFNDLSSLEAFARLESADVANLAPEDAEIVSLAKELQSAGCPLLSVGGRSPQPLVTRTAVLDAVRNGKAQVATNESRTSFQPVADLAALKQVAAAFRGDVEEVAADNARSLTVMSTLERMGVRWAAKQPDGKMPPEDAPKLNPVGQLKSLHDGTLVGFLPERKVWNYGFRKRAEVKDAERLNALGRTFEVG